MAQYALIMLGAGIGVSVLAAMNASLGRHVGSPDAAATVPFVVAFVSVLTVAVGVWLTFQF